jgi:hypothetical protein
MKLSVETQVGTAVAAAFIAMTAIVIAQRDSPGETGVPDAYGPRNDPTIALYSRRYGLMRFVCNEEVK